MKIIEFVLLCMTFVVSFSCKGNDAEVDKLRRENDSLQNVSAYKGQILDDLTSALVEVSNSLDSITVEEQTIKRKVEEGGFASKKEFVETLEMFKTQVANYRLRLRQLESELSGKSDQLAKMSQLIAFLNEELIKKEAKIESLKEQLNKRNADIANLWTKVSTLENTVAVVQNENDNQKETIKGLSEVYYIVGTSKELKGKKILTGGFLKKKKVDYSSLDLSLFKKVNSSELTQIVINSKSAKVMTNVPSESYKIESLSDETCVLKILNVDKFWSLSKVLIIQTK